MAQAMLRITLVKSVHGYESDQMDTARALGLRRMHQSVVRRDTPSLRGMVRKITHLVATEEVMDQEVTPTFRRHRPAQAEPSLPAAVTAKPRASAASTPKMTAAATVKTTVGAKADAKAVGAPKVAAKPAAKPVAKPAAKPAAKAPAKKKPEAAAKVKVAPAAAAAKAPAKSKPRKEPTAK